MNFKKLSVFGFSSALLLAAASCSNDNIMPEPDKVLESDQTFYMNISVNGSANLSRAGEIGAYGSEGYDPTDEPNYQVGTGTENDVNSIYLLFFDANGNHLRTATVVNNSDGSVETGQPSENPSEHKIYSGVVQVAGNKGELIPSYVIAFVNPINANFTNDAEFGTINKVEQTLRTNLINTVNGKDFFAMSNSVYYGSDPVSGLDNVRIVATPIMANQIFTTESAARQAINQGGSTVDIFVERYAAKVNFQFEGAFTGDNSIISDIEVVNSADPSEHYTLTFEPLYWAVNAVEKQTYVTKNYFKKDGSSVDFSQPGDFSWFNGIFAGWSGWNSAENHRSFWGQSKGYYEARYPRTADDIVANTATNPYSLKYYSYGEIAAEASRENFKNDFFARKVADGGSSNFLYTRENTVQGQALIDAYNNTTGPASAIASVVLVGKYEVKNSSGATVNLPEGDDCFYITGNKDRYTYYTKANMVKYFMNQAINFFYPNPAYDGESDEPQYLPVFAEGAFATGYADAFTLAHPNAGVLQNMALDSRFVTLQVDLSKLAAGKDLYAELNGEIVKVTSANLDIVNRLVFSAVGTTRGFNGGKAYYNIPIKHLGFYRSGNDNAGLMPNSEAWDWTKVQSGDFGVVRNHIYTINVKSIEGLGNAIPNPTDPIVPPNDEDYYIGARIIVLNWALVPTQDVTL